MGIPDVTVVFPTQACQGHVIMGIHRRHADELGKIEGIEAKKMTFSHD